MKKFNIILTVSVILFITSIVLFVNNGGLCEHSFAPGNYIAEIKNIKSAEEARKVGEKLLTQLYGNRNKDKEVQAFYDPERNVWEIGYFATSDTGLRKSNAGHPIIEINKDTGLINRIYLGTESLS